MRWLALLSMLLCATSVAAAPGTGGPRVFALIVGSNRAPSPDQQPLHYADDDAARFYELITALGGEAVLLTAPDAETQALFPGLATVAIPATRQDLLTSMARLRKQIAEARGRGERTVFFFYYAGHGTVGADHEGYVHLQDGRLSRSDLLQEIVARSPAHLNHVVIDACNAFYLVHKRGGSATAGDLRAMRQFLASESIERYPNTGVLLSTAGSADSFEWARFRSGIFSHQLISGLLGGADVNGDRRVDYREIAAYIAAANLRVSDPAARIQVDAHPPAVDVDAPLVDLQAAAASNAAPRQPAARRLAALLRVPRSFSGHYVLEDDRGVRHLEFNKTAEQPLLLALLDRPRYYLRAADREAVIALDGLVHREGGNEPLEIDAGKLAFGEVPLQRRGALEDSLARGLFAFPFGGAFAAGFAARREADPTEMPGGAGPAKEPPATTRRDLTSSPNPWYARLGTWKWTAAGVSLSAIVVGVVLEVLAQQAADQLHEGRDVLTMEQAVVLQQRAADRRVGAGVSFGIAAAAGVGSAVLFLFDRGSARRARASRFTTGAVVTAQSASLSLSTTF